MINAFYSNPKWNATEFNLSEATTVSFAISSLNIQDENFIGDIGDIIRMHLKAEATQEDLVMLAYTTAYMRNFEYCKDLYSLIHATAI